MQQAVALPLILDPLTQQAQPEAGAQMTTAASDPTSGGGSLGAQLAAAAAAGADATWGGAPQFALDGSGMLPTDMMKLGQAGFPNGVLQWPLAAFPPMPGPDGLATLPAMPPLQVAGAGPGGPFFWIMPQMPGAAAASAAVAVPTAAVGTAVAEAQLCGIEPTVAGAEHGVPEAGAAAVAQAAAPPAAATATAAAQAEAEAAAARAVKAAAVPKAGSDRRPQRRAASAAAAVWAGGASSDEEVCTDEEEAWVRAKRARRAAGAGTGSLPQQPASQAPRRRRQQQNQQQGEVVEVAGIVARMVSCVAAACGEPVLPEALGMSPAETAAAAAGGPVALQLHAQMHMQRAMAAQIQAASMPSMMGLLQQQESEGGDEEALGASRRSGRPRRASVHLSAAMLAPEQLAAAFDSPLLPQLSAMSAAVPSGPKVCAECGTRSTPLWRTVAGQIYCNADGLRMKRKLGLL